MAFGIKRWRSRSPERDSGTDRSRFRQVSASIDTAIMLATNEHDGLNRRIQHHYDTAAAMLENVENFDQRSAEDENRIRALELEADAGKARLAQLKAQLALLEDLKERLISSQLYFESDT